MEIRITFLLGLLFFGFSCQDGDSQEATSQGIESSLSDSLKGDSLAFHSGIRSIFQDSKGNYWLGSHNEGLARFDGRQYEYFTIENGLHDNQVISAQEDGSGNIWIGTAKGLSQYKSGKMMQFFAPNYGPKSEWALAASDHWFVGGNISDVIRVNEGKPSYLNLPPNVHHNTRNDYGITGFSRGQNGNIWIAYYAGLTSFDGSNFVSINDQSLGHDTQFLHVRSVLEDGKGRLWIGNNGLGLLLKEGDSIVHFSKKMGLMNENGDENEFPSPPGTLKHVFSITEDRSGNIWFGDRDTGVWKYDGTSMINYTIDPKLKSQMVWIIYEDRSGNLLFGMSEGGVYQWNDGSFVRKF